MDTTKAQKLYRDSNEIVRGRFDGDVEKARAQYKKYLDFILANTPKQNSKVLDVGCGSGWTTLFLRQAGHDAHGMDLHEKQLEARAIDESIPYTPGDIQNIPFAAGTFDLVTMHDVLEHVPNPQLALEECLRVLKPGGRLLVVGPNLLSFPSNLRWAVHHTIRVLRQGKLWEQRTEDMPRHPGGNTMPEAWKCTFRNLWLTLTKLAAEKDVKFLMREPDTQPPFHADNDACYFCNPMDLLNWAKTKSDLKPVQWWSNHRPGAKYYWPLVGGTWIVLEKT